MGGSEARRVPRMARTPAMRKTLSAPGLLKEVRACFDRIEDPVASRGLSQTGCLMSGLAMFGMKYPSLLKFEESVREAIRHNLATWRQARAVGHRDAGTARRGGSAAIAALFHEAVPASAARQGAGGICLSERALPSFDRRDGILFLGQGALPELLREASPRRHDDILSSDVGGRSGASGSKGGFSVGTGADLEGGRGEKERLRTQCVEATSGRPAPRASALEVDRAGGRAGLEWAP